MFAKHTFDLGGACLTALDGVKGLEVQEKGWDTRVCGQKHRVSTGFTQGLNRYAGFVDRNPMAKTIVAFMAVGEGKKKEGKDYPFWRQLNEKPQDCTGLPRYGSLLSSSALYPDCPC